MICRSLGITDGGRPGKNAFGCGFVGLFGKQASSSLQGVFDSALVDKPLPVQSFSMIDNITVNKVTVPTFDHCLFKSGIEFSIKPADAEVNQETVSFESVTGSAEISGIFDINSFFKGGKLCVKDIRVENINVSTDGAKPELQEIIDDLKSQVIDKMKEQIKEFFPGTKCVN